MAGARESVKFSSSGSIAWMSTIRRSDQILVMEGGEIVERGTHEALYAMQGRYHELYTRQHGLERNLFLAPGEGDSAEDAGEKS